MIPEHAAQTNTGEPLLSESKLHLDALRQPCPPVMKSRAFKLSELRIPQDFDTSGEKQVQLTIPILKPSQMKQFFRAHTEWCLPARVLEYERSLYILTAQIASELEGDAKHRLLVPCITRNGDLFVWPLGVPKPVGKTDSWTASALRALSKSRHAWIRLVSNLDASSYKAISPKEKWPDPVWPDLTEGQFFEVAFQDLVVCDSDHPVLKSLRGEL